MGDASGKPRGGRGASEEVMSKDDQKKLFKEWEADYAARREENRREGVSTAGPPETWPSEIVKANRLKQPEHGQGKVNGQEHSHGHEEGHSM
jgi:hypothetical protein